MASSNLPKEFHNAPRPIDSTDPIDVRFRFTTRQISHISTVECSAYVKVGVVFYWNDARLIGYKPWQTVPEKLWGPDILLCNDAGEAEIEQEEFFVCDGDTGRIKRGLVFKATVQNAMWLQDFPFDSNNVEVLFTTISRWSTYDRSLTGEAYHGSTYCLRRVDPGSNDGRFHAFIYTKASLLPEWQICGFSHSMTTHTTKVNTQVKTSIAIRYHMRRKWTYYLYKVIIPLYLLSIFGYRSLFYSPENISDKDANTSTIFLSTFALLFVISESLPKGLNVLTTIDRVIGITLVNTLATLGINFYVHYIFLSSGEDEARFYNYYLGLGIFGFFVVSNIVIYAGPCIRSYRSRLKLKKSNPKFPLPRTSMLTIPKGGSHDSIYIPVDNELNEKVQKHSQKSKAVSPKAD